MAMSGTKIKSSHYFYVSDGWMFLSGIYLARICQGLSISIIGPTLLYLANNVEATVQRVSIVFTGRALGILFGAILSAYVIPKGRPLYSLAIGVLVLGLTYGLLPFVFSAPLMFFVFTIFGIAYGYLDAGQQALLLKLWGEKDSRMHIQGYHFGFTFGAIFGPILARPFLVSGKLMRNDKTVCPSSIINSNGTDVDYHAGYNTTAKNSSIFSHGFNPAGWAYIIPSMLMAAVTIWYLCMAVMKVDEKIQNSRKRSKLATESRGDKKLKDVWFIFLLVVMFYFFLIGSEHSFLTFLYSIAVCEFKINVSTGSILNTITWVGMTIGRLGGTLMASHLLPQTIIVISANLCLLSVVMMSLFGQHSAVTWIFNFTYSVFVAPLFPAAVSWLSEIINISGRYMFIIYVGSEISSMISIPISGSIFQDHPIGVLYYCAGLIFLQCVVFGLMTLTKRNFIRKQSNHPPHVAIEVTEAEIEKLTITRRNN